MAHVGYKAIAARLKVGTTLPGQNFHVATSPTEALRLGGLWPGGRPSMLYRLETEDEVTRVGEHAEAASWTVLAAIPPRDHLASLTRELVDFEKEALSEQLEWRKALGRPNNDPAKVEQSLRLAMKRRGLKNWRLKRAPSSSWLRQQPVEPSAMYTWSGHATISAWEAWDREADEDEAYDKARRVAWSLWYDPTPFDHEDAFNLGGVEVTPEVWDAWTALVVFYTAEQGWLELPAQSFTAGIREAYEHGLALAKPLERGVLSWATE